MARVLDVYQPGTTLATGLGQGLHALAQNRFNEIMQQKQQQQAASGLQALLGLQPQQASALSQISPELQQLYVKQALEAPQQQAFAQALGLASGGELEQQQQASSQAQQPSPIQQIPGRLSSKQALEVAKFQQAERLAKTKASHQEKQEEKKQQVEANKETKKYYDNILALDEAAEASEKRLNRMENLINKKGGLPVSTFYKLFKNIEEQVPATYGAAAGAAAGGAIGGPLGAAVGGTIGGLISPVATLLRSAQTLTSPNTEEFEKLSNDFVREAKSIFGSRITDQDLKTFMSLVPSLSQTDNGKRAIIRNLRNFLEANKIKAKALKQIVRSNGGKRPFDLPILVEERVKPELDKLAKEFVG